MAKKDTYLTQTGEEVQAILNAVGNKTDKIPSAAGHLAAINASGNLADSGVSAAGVNALVTPPTLYCGSGASAEQKANNVSVLKALCGITDTNPGISGNVPVGKPVLLAKVGTNYVFPASVNTIKVTASDSRSVEYSYYIFLDWTTQTQEENHQTICISASNGGLIDGFDPSANGGNVKTLLVYRDISDYLTMSANEDEEHTISATAGSEPFVPLYASGNRAGYLSLGSRVMYAFRGSISYGHTLTLSSQQYYAVYFDLSDRTIAMRVYADNHITTTWQEKGRVDISGKADKAVPSVAGNIAKLDATGNLADSGKSVDDLVDIQDATGTYPLLVNPDNYQLKLVSGTNIKTINNQSILGSGNITIEGGGGGGLSDEVKQAILDAFEHVAWVTNQGQTYYNALADLFFPPKTLTSITAVYTQSGTVYDDASLDSLKTNLVVTAYYDDNTSAVVTNYTLSGTLSAGTSTVTVTYQSKTTTFSVTVTARPTVANITATYTQSGTVYTTDSLDSLKSDLVVKAVYTDTTEDTLNASDYTLSGTLTTGTSTITVSYSGKTTTFTVVVTAAVVTSIDALFTQGTATITTNNSLDDLRQYLVVTANYNNGTTSTVTNYTLSGTLEEGTSTITVTYEGKTDTFTVTTSQEGVLYQLATPKIADGSTRTDTGVKLADVDKDWSICYDYELTSVPSATSSSYSFGNINIGVSDAKARTSSLVYNPSGNESTSLSVYMNGIVGNHAIGVITHSVGSKCVKYNIEYTIGGTKYPFTGTTPVQSHALIVSQATMQFGATNGTSHKFNRFVINDYVLTNEEITNFMTGGNE